MKKGIIQKYVELGYEKHSGFPSEVLDQQPIGSKYKQIEYFLIQKRLREEYNVHILIDIDDLNWWFQVFDISKLDQFYQFTAMTPSKAGFKTYEQALESGLQEALKLIK